MCKNISKTIKGRDYATFALTRQILRVKNSFPKNWHDLCHMILKIGHAIQNISEISKDRDFKFSTQLCLGKFHKTCK